MKNPIGILTVCAAILVCLATALSAAEAPDDPIASGRVRAGLYISPPFVMTEKYGGYTGIAVELWEAVAKGLDVKTEYRVYSNIRDLLNAAKLDEIDVVVLAIAATHKRSGYLRFSFPWYDSGLLIMVNEDTHLTFWEEMARFGHYRMYMRFFFVFMIMAFGMTLLRRRKDPDFPEDWKTGFTRSLLDVVASIKSGRLDQSYLGWVGSLISAGWMIFGVAAAAYVTSSITSAMTTASLSKVEISSLVDLLDKKVGVKKGGLSEGFLTEMGIETAPYNDLDDAAQAMLAKKVDAVVCDAPALRYFIKSHPDMPLMETGDLFRQEKYCFVTGLKRRDLMDRISEELIWLHEAGKIQSLQSHYMETAQ